MSELVIASHYYYKMVIFLALADEFNQNAEFFEMLIPPFSSQNPFDMMTDGMEKIKEDYFGTSMEARRMYKTLYNFSDFNRYIIETNGNYVDNSVFFQKSNGCVNPVSLYNIMQLIANIVKHNFKWNDKLGNLDDYVF